MPSTAAATSGAHFNALSLLIPPCFVLESFVVKAAPLSSKPMICGLLLGLSNFTVKFEFIWLNKKNKSQN